ncbi:MAG: hypothetical protein LBU32_22460 [Clostridiales bacterium]|nr:hypothetical protein [Clostridiales bacterium]
MNKKSIIPVIAAAVIAALAKSQWFDARALSRANAGASLAAQDFETDGKGAYLLEIELEESNKGRIGCYMVKYRQDDFNMATTYAQRFIEIEDAEEDENSYIFSGSGGVVKIDRAINQVHFEAAPSGFSDEYELKSDEEAIMKAVEFISARRLVLFYEEAQVHFDGDVYKIAFINRISSLKNYAFSNEASIDRHGRLISLDYYAVQYDKVGSCQIKSMKEAFFGLPDLDREETVSIKSCELVCIYDDSIVQPAYYFQGEASGKSFECFVKAAVF